MKWLFCTLLGCFWSWPLVPRQGVERTDEAIFTEKIKLAATEKTLAGRAVAVGKSFIGTPYRSGVLDGLETEELVVNLRGLDCWTFVENCLAVGLTAQAGRSDFEFFKTQLQQLRYWGGTVDGYGSRIHYFSGWILQAEKLGLLRDMTQEMGGLPLRKQFNYMTTHAHHYPKLADPKVRRDLENAEQRINAHSWFFIPKSKVAAAQHLIRDGDIIATTSTKAGLDISHQGFAVRQNGQVHLLHASSEFGRVMLSKWPLPTYMGRNKGQSGIMVFRLN